MTKVNEKEAGEAHLKNLIEQLNCLKWTYATSCSIIVGRINCTTEVVVAQLVERSLPTPEVCGSNPVIGKIYMYYHLY